MRYPWIREYSLTKSNVELKKQIDSINLVRKTMQLENAPKLKSLARKWEETVYKNHQIKVRRVMRFVSLP